MGATRNRNLLFRSPLLISLAFLSVLASGIAFAQISTPSTAPPEKQLPLLPRDPKVVREAATKNPAGVPAPNPDGFKSLLGYTGRYFNRSGQSGRVTVLEKTVSVLPGSNWQVVGLVRNETDVPIGEIEVSAQLLNSAGEIVGTANAASLVRGIRSGEPAPFLLGASVPSGAVASVKYTATGKVGQSIWRDFELTTYWQLPYGDRPRRDAFLHSDPQAPPYPYVIAGSVRNMGGTPVSPILVAAWLDPEGRVIHVANLARPLLKGKEPASIRNIGSFYYANSDPVIAPKLVEAEISYWAGASA